jgi:hypothetical protein
VGFPSRQPTHARSAAASLLVPMPATKHTKVFRLQKPNIDARRLLHLRKAIFKQKQKERERLLLEEKETAAVLPDDGMHPSAYSILQARSIKT